jgi:DNA-binding transcriptional ArsR family regulator
MARLLPSLSSSAPDDASPRVIGLDSADADDLIGALSSRTARRILAALHEEPASASEVAAQVDSSLQNVQYHLGRMEDAGLVEVFETVYSEKGREMKVYAPSDKPLVVVAARESETSGLRDALTRLLGAVGVLGLVSLLVQFLLDESGPAGGAATSADSAEGARIAAETTTAAAATGLPPGLLFFLGGLVVILGTFVVWWYRSR